MSAKGPPVPDTRLPFKGCLAFNRNGQEYIPFRTETDAMLASLTLAYRLASPVLAVVLALVRHPSFNPVDITLSNPEDVWARVAEHAAEKRPRRVICFPHVFPRVILNEVVDILGEERRAELYVQRDTDGPQMGLIEYDKTDRDLRSVSLVCKDWAQPAQRTLGKILTLQDVRTVNLINALKSPLFGPWTTETLIFRHNRELDDRGRTELLNYGNEVWELMAKLTERTPNVRAISFCTDWYELPFRHVAQNFTTLPLQELRLVQAGDMTQLLGAVCCQVKYISTLKHLYLQWSGFGSVYNNFVPESQLEEDSPPPSLEKVTLKIGSASALSLRYINWLTRPREGDNAFRLKSLALDLSACYYSEDTCVRALEACFSTLSDLWIIVSGLSEGMLSRIFSKCLVLKNLTIVIRHTFDNSMFDLPYTLETLCSNLSFEQPEWELWDSRSHLFLTRRYRNLRHISLQLAPATGYSEVRNPKEMFPNSCALAKDLGIRFDVSLSNLRTSGSCSNTSNSSWVR